MSNWEKLTAEEKRRKIKNLEETKDTLFLFRHHDGSVATRRHGKYAGIKKNMLDEDVIVLEDVDGYKSLGRPLSGFDVSLPPFEKETLQQEYERTKLQPEKLPGGGSIMHFVNHPPYKEWLRLKELGLIGDDAGKRKTRKKPKRKGKRKTKKRKIKKRKARKRKTRKRFRNRRRKR